MLTPNDGLLEAWPNGWGNDGATLVSHIDPPQPVMWAWYLDQRETCIRLLDAQPLEMRFLFLVLTQRYTRSVLRRMRAHLN